MPPLTPKKPPTIKPVDTATRFNMLLYGHTGAGKTTFVGSGAKCPELGKILLLAPDPGVLTLAFDEDANANIEVGVISSVSDLDAWYEWLRVENPKTNTFQTLVLDGVTDLAELALVEALASQNEKDSDRDPDKPDVDHWGRVNVIVRRHVRQFRDLPLAFIATALVKDVQDAKTGELHTVPSLSGKLAVEIGSYFDIIGYIYTEQKKDLSVVRRLRVQRDNRFQAKDRTKKLGTIIENPDLPYIMDRIKNGPVENHQVHEPKINMPKIQIKNKN